MMASLQGIINRKQPRIYLLERSSEGARTWLESLELASVDFTEPLGLVAKYREELNGVIVYDPDFSDSINLATTLAGLKSALVVSPDMAKTLAAVPFELPVLDDLRGRFNSRLEAYQWQFDTLWPQVNQRMLIGLSPGHSRRTRSGLPIDFELLAEEKSPERGGRNRKLYELDLSQQVGGELVFLQFSDASTRDGWGAAVHRVEVLADGKTIASFVPGTPDEEAFLYDPQRSQIGDGFRYADGERKFTYRFQIPNKATKLLAKIDMRNQFRVAAGKVEPRMPWEPSGPLRDYAVANRAMVFWLDANAPAERGLMEKILQAACRGTPYLGWFGNDIEGEFGAVELTSRYGVPVVPADWFNNLTVFSGTRAQPNQPPPAEKTRPTRELQHRIYVTFTFGEGDNLQYNQHHLRKLWDDPARGKVPINWSSTPLLLDAAPAIFDYYQRTKTSNDYLLSGPSSVGYFYPEPWPDDYLGSHLRNTRSYVERSAMVIPYVLNRTGHRDVPLSAHDVRTYRDEHEVPGILLGWGEEFGLEWIEGVPVANVRGIGSIEEGHAVLARAKRQWNGQSPLFLSVGVLAWNLTPSDVVELIEALGDEFEVVTADEYFQLIRNSKAPSK